MWHHCLICRRSCDATHTVWNTARSPTPAPKSACSPNRLLTISTATCSLRCTISFRLPKTSRKATFSRHWSLTSFQISNDLGITLDGKSIVLSTSGASSLDAMVGTTANTSAVLDQEVRTNEAWPKRRTWTLHVSIYGRHPLLKRVEWMREQVCVVRKGFRTDFCFWMEGVKHKGLNKPISYLHYLSGDRCSKTEVRGDKGRQMKTLFSFTKAPELGQNREAIVV